MKLDFTVEDEIIRKIMALYMQTRSQLVIFAPPIVAIRIIWGFISGYKPTEMLMILRDLIVCFCLLLMFSQYIDFILKLQSFGIQMFGEIATNVNVEPDKGNVIGEMLAEKSNFIFIGGYWFSLVLYYSAMLIMIALSSYAIFTFTIFGNYTALIAYFTITLIVGLIPVFWQTVNYSVSLLFDKESHFMNNMLIILGNLVKTGISFAVFLISIFKPFIQPALTGFSKVSNFAKSTYGFTTSASQKTASFATSSITTLGGEKYINNMNKTKHEVKKNALDKLSNTIPTIEKYGVRSYSKVKNAFSTNSKTNDYSNVSVQNHDSKVESKSINKVSSNSSKMINNSQLKVRTIKKGQSQSKTNANSKIIAVSNSSKYRVKNIKQGRNNDTTPSNLL